MKLQKGLQWIDLITVAKKLSRPSAQALITKNSHN